MDWAAGVDALATSSRRLPRTPELHDGFVGERNALPGCQWIYNTTYYRHQSEKKLLSAKVLICHLEYSNVWLKCESFRNKTCFSLLYSYFRLSENKTINVFPIDYIVQLSKLTSQWANKYLTLRFNK